MRGKPVTIEVTDPDGTQLINLHETGYAGSYDANPNLSHRILYTGTSGGGVIGQPVPADASKYSGGSRYKRKTTRKSKNRKLKTQRKTKRKSNRRLRR